MNNQHFLHRKKKLCYIYVVEIASGVNLMFKKASSFVTRDNIHYQSLKRVVKLEYIVTNGLNKCYQPTISPIFDL